ncbi:DNA primase [Hyphomonas adhaerens MHS-3]|uniref:DNA primase n=1 Tax=Hyphomonas adhaerens MHS-3 TaxID=1280949 RepID=A0A069E672_9PROT|nr:DNA primase [Hyphomonas adhaerens]KCZ85562.1 DNA primase [Hyphomonas adhaerens MHS-3]
MAPPSIRIPDGFVEELKARIRPSDVIGRKVKLTKKGKEWVGLSPFTNEKSPSFYVNDQKRIFKDFSSGLGGDVISFIMETERLSFMEAVEKLAEEAGMELPKASPQAAEEYDHRKRLQAVCEAATAYFEDRLNSSEGMAARTYLEGRGLRPAAWKRHRLGYSPDDWRKTIDHLKSQGFSTKEILEAGLAKESDRGGEPYDAFRGRLMFPIADVRGGIIAFGGRALQPDAKPKYLNSGDTPLFHKSRVLYRYKVAREALGGGDGGGLLVCEGYMDAIALAEAGFGTSVAPLGTALTEDQLSMIWRAGPEPVLCFDGDRAGLGAAYRAIDRALPHVEPGRSLFFVLLPDGMDPDDLIRARGPGAMSDALEERISMSELLWLRERDAEPLDTPERQAGLEARLMAAAAQIQHPGVRAAYERDLKSRMRDHFWQLRQASRGRSKGSGDYRKRPGTGQFPASGDQGQVELKGGAPAKLRGLGQVVRAVDTPELLDLGAETLAAAVFADPDVSRMRDAVLDFADAGKPIDREALSAHLAEAGNMRAASLLNEYPQTPPIAVDGPEAREWLIALEQYMVAGRSAEQDTDTGMDDAGADATSSPSAWRRKHQLVAERRALRARMNEAAGKVGES